MENSNNIKHQNSLKKIAVEIKNAKQNIKETYKKLKCTNQKDQDIFSQNLYVFIV